MRDGPAKLGPTLRFFPFKLIGRASFRAPTGALEVIATDMWQINVRGIGTKCGRVRRSSPSDPGRPHSALNLYRVLRISPKSICIFEMLSMLIVAKANINVEGTGFHQTKPHGTLRPLSLPTET